ncbi:MAG TPA: hypothetical protein VD903_20945 [Pseudonocardia sp.]|nr:hypothetical protein [Pseudonocardia sp.]
MKRSAIVPGVSTLVNLVAAVAFLVWLCRARLNAEALGGEQRHGRAAARGARGAPPPQQEGLVRAEARGMLRVNSLSPEEILELFRVRAALEGLAVAEVLARPDREAALTALRAAVEAIEEASRAPRPGAGSCQLEEGRTR